MVQTNNESIDRIRQGDILKDIEYIEYADEKDGIISISKINFPLVIVLTQDCDLTWDYETRKSETKNQDKYMLSVILAPLYNYEHFIRGDHLSELQYKMQIISGDPNKTDNKRLRDNETPRYHYLEFNDKVPIVTSVIDFKHYFTVNMEQLQEKKTTHFVCTVNELYREQITQRYANYLSRIGLPDIKEKNGKL